MFNQHMDTLLYGLEVSTTFWFLTNEKFLSNSLLQKWYLCRFSYPNDPHLWRVQSLVCLGLVWASSHPQWPWWDWECCWPCLRTSLPISACGSWLWLDTNCHSHWHGGSRLPWLRSHSGFCHWHCFSHWLHSHFSEPSRASYPSWNWQRWTIIVWEEGICFSYL